MTASTGSALRAAALGPLRVPVGRAARARRLDRAHHVLLRLVALVVVAVVLLIVWECLSGSWPALRASGVRFLVSTEWDPVAERFGALPYLYGTFVSSALALLIAVPLGIGTAVYLAELAPRVWGNTVSFVVELLAAIPSIVFGLWGLFVLAPVLRAAVEPWLIAHAGFLPLFQGFPFGIGMLNAGLVLGVMIVPTVVSISREVLRSMPRSLPEAALGLGATRAEALAVSLDAARPGILGAVILALGRALGETMAVTMVIGNSNRISASLLAPSATMASVIANEFTEATGKLHLAALIEIALVLLAVTVVTNTLARLLVIWTTGGRRDVAGAA